jgi:hypothetical protein
MDRTKPLAWFLEYADAMGLALFAAMSTALMTGFLRGHTGLKFIVGLLSAFTLTGIGVPFAAVHWSLHWVWWPIIGAAIGLTSLSAMWFAIRFADRAAQRAPDFADGLGKRIVPEAPEGARPPLPPSTDDR